MSMMAPVRRGVTGGVDAHADAHHAAVLDEQGRLLGTRAFPATARGYRQLADWLEAHGEVAQVGVESTGSYAAALVRTLRARQIAVVEVNQPHPHARMRRGKSDRLDAEMAARAALAGTARALPKATGGVVEAIRQLALVRAGAVKARTAALSQIGDILVTAPADLRERLAARRTLRGTATLCARLRPDLGHLDCPRQAAKLALHTLGRRIVALEAEIASLETELARMVARAAPRTTALLGVSTGHAGQLMVSAGQNIERMRSEAAFARLCAAAPKPASSGRTTRNRLDVGGDRQANRALYMIAVCRLRYCERTRAYAARRTAEGMSKREIIRCLKRYIARELFHTLSADLAALREPTVDEEKSLKSSSSP